MILSLVEIQAEEEVSLSVDFNGFNLADSKGIRYKFVLMVEGESTDTDNIGACFDVGLYTFQI